MQSRILCSLLITCLLGSVAVAQEDKGGGALPERFNGFDGTLGGKVVSTEQDGSALTMKVTDVLNVNQKSTAKAPKTVVGRTVTVTPKMAKGNDGKMHPNQRHANFIQTLNPGEDVQVDVATVGDRLEITILTRAEKKAADKQSDKEKKQ